ncbi:MAG TPA: cyclopropane-fatty-acyl-phospholipid synthase family protein [Acidiferrobacterales bacterium]|nr:cyclopropane-fatty-acyl-phospholipid synthase family protein [Acidiferrobacterales bacterium]
MLDELLKNNIKIGSLRVHFTNGEVRQYGHGLPCAQWIFHDPDAPKRILRDPELGLGVTYMEKGWSTAEGALPALLKILLYNFQYPRSRLHVFPKLLRYFQQLNRVWMSRRNVEFHYDLDEWLFRCFLDKEMHYSCAYFNEPGVDLEQAQRAKCEHIMRKLSLRPGQRVLDIGSGWGGLALFLAEQAGVHVTGLTLSREQLRVAEQAAHKRGLKNSVRFLSQDYRQHQGQYDRIVSVGMFEHVGAPNYSAFFHKLNTLLKQDGVALLHSIGRPGLPGETNAWIRKYIFPGGYNPALSEITQAIQASRLIITDVEVLRLHYGFTLAEWQKRFQAHRKLVAERKGERFARMWEFYLAVCEAAFAAGELVVYQIQMSNSLKSLPLTRDYLYPKQAKMSEPTDLEPVHQPHSRLNSD